MKLRISEIPDDKSEREFSCTAGELNLEAFTEQDVRLKVRFNKLPDFIQLSFDAKAELRLMCDRSLEYFMYPVETTYSILFKPGIEPSEDEQQAIRPLVISSNEIDIGQEVRDSILLSIPIKKLHPRFVKDDGSPTEFTEVYGAEEEQDDEDEQPTDPRWDALKKLKN